MNRNKTIENKELEKIKPVIVGTLKKHGIKKAGIFGSYVRNEQNKNSDIDIVVKAPKGIGLTFITINLELEDKLAAEAAFSICRKYLSIEEYNAVFSKRLGPNGEMRITPQDIGATEGIAE